MIMYNLRLSCLMKEEFLSYNLYPQQTVNTSQLNQVIDCLQHYLVVNITWLCPVRIPVSPTGAGVTQIPCLINSGGKFVL